MCLISFDKGADWELTISNILVALNEVNDPYTLGIHLGIKPKNLDVIEKENSEIINRITKVIIHWMRNSENRSWGTLANAVRKMGVYERTVKKLRDLENHSTGLENNSDKIEGT